MNIAIVGTGYVGLVTACCLANAGNNVTCIDNDPGKIETLQAGNVPIFEPGLKEMLQQNKQRLTFTTDLAKGVSEAKAIFLALPTPPQEDGSADLSIVLSVADQLGKFLPSRYCVIVNKSTVPVGTAEAVKEAVAKSAMGEFEVVSNPEFLREGKAVQDFMEPDRVVVGITSKQAEQVMREIYEPFTSEDRPLLVTDPRTAELTKYAANTFLVTKISFMNEIAELSERMGADVDMVRQAIGSDSRIGPKFLYPGIGSGGSCFPKDTRALKHMAWQHDYNFKLLDAAIVINDQQKHLLVQKLLAHFGDNIEGKKFALWGLAFKPGTDDIREAPSLVIIDELLKRGAGVNAFDPKASEHVKQKYLNNPALAVATDQYEVLKDADALVIATEWPEFVESDLSKVKQLLKQPIIFDGRNIFQPKSMQAAGFVYYSVGRRPVLQK